MMKPPWSLKRDEAALREKQEVVTRSHLNTKPGQNACEIEVKWQGLF
jgi:hypothetical protein